MKIFGLLATLFCSFISIGQKSYYFSEPVPSIENRVENISSNYFGTYQSSNGRTYEISNDGIFIISTSVSSISRETIRESSTYTVRNGFIHGVILNDSIPCVLEGERYYFGIKNKDVLVGPSSDNVLTKSSATLYYINTFENGQYIPTKIEFVKKSLIVSHFDYETDSNPFDFVTSQKKIETPHHELIVLSPTMEEFSQMKASIIFPETKEYTRVR